MTRVYLFWAEWELPLPRPSSLCYPSTQSLRGFERVFIQSCIAVVKKPCCESKYLVLQQHSQVPLLLKCGCLFSHVLWFYSLDLVHTVLSVVGCGSFGVGSVLHYSCTKDSKQQAGSKGQSAKWAEALIQEQLLLWLSSAMLTQASVDWHCSLCNVARLEMMMNSSFFFFLQWAFK